MEEDPRDHERHKVVCQARIKDLAQGFEVRAGLEAEAHDSNARDNHVHGQEKENPNRSVETQDSGCDSHENRRDEAHVCQTLDVALLVERVRRVNVLLRHRLKLLFV